MKISIKELFEIAKSELENLSKVSNPDFRLEQVEYDDSKKHWDVVVSYLVEDVNKRANPLGIPISEFQFYRIYKRLKINSEREIIGLYIYEKKNETY